MAPRERACPAGAASRQFTSHTRQRAVPSNTPGNVSRSQVLFFEEKVSDEHRINARGVEAANRRPGITHHRLSE